LTTSTVPKEFNSSWNKIISYKASQKTSNIAVWLYLLTASQVEVNQFSFATG